MDFVFFDFSGKPVFVRDDVESAHWTVQDMSLQALFPRDESKVILRGMRIGFTDETGIFQPFEIRKVKNYEPDHYQEITCEHIAVAELTDCHYAGTEVTNVTPQSVLTTILAGTGWSVGNVTATNTSSADFSMGSVWEDVRKIESDWNVWITPRVTYNSSGIAGKYLDVIPADGVWRGIRLSLDKNADEVGVIIDDSMVVTALYGYGTSSNGSPINFADVVWQQTADHPAKPSGQLYLEDAAATALYGRNGNARFGFFQDSSISDPNVLLEQTWKTLKTTNRPTVTVDCMVRDLYRLGYADQPIRLHDTALVDIDEMGFHEALTIVNLEVDLLDPTATRPTIGTYIPNIIYINRETNARGGGSGRLSGQRGIVEKNWTIEIGSNKDDIEKIYQKTAIDHLTANETLYSRTQDNKDNITQNTSDISTLDGKVGSVPAGQNLYTISQTNASNIAKADVKIGAVPEGSNLYGLYQGQESSISTLNNKTGIGSLGTGETLYSRTASNASDISGLNTKVGSVPSGSNLYSLHQSNAGSISTLQGKVQTLETNTSGISKGGDTTTISHLAIGNGAFDLDGRSASWQSQYVLTSLSITMPSITLSTQMNFVAHISGAWDWDHLTAVTNSRVVTGYTAGSVTGPSGKTIYYVGGPAPN